MLIPFFSSMILIFGSLPLQAQAPPASVPLERNLRVAGTVVDDLSGQPLARAQVFLFLQSVRDFQLTTVTAQDGHFSFEGLVPGKYTLSAQRKGYLPQAYKQHGQFSTAIIVGADLDTGNLRFALLPEAAISGRVLDEMNEPVRNAQVLLFREGLSLGTRGTRQENGTSTDDRGQFRLAHLAAGTYFVAVSARPWYAQPVTHQRMITGDSSGKITETVIATGEPDLDVLYPVTFFPNTTGFSGAAPITMHAGDAETADFTLHPVPALHMTIRTGSPGESEGIWVEVSQPLIGGVQNQMPVSSQQTAPGIFEISGLPPGRLNVRLGTSKDGNTVYRSQNVQLAGDLDLNAAEAMAFTSVSGSFKTDDGSPLSQPAQLQLRNKASGEILFMHADGTKESKFRELDLAPGTYDVAVVSPGAAALKRLTATGARISGNTLEIEAGQHAELNVVISRGTSSISGVALKDGKPIDGVLVIMVPEVPEHNLVLFRRDQSDSDGSFNLNGILPGKYTLVAIENAWELEWFKPGVIQKYLAGGKEVRVTPDSKQTVNVNVQP